MRLNLICASSLLLLPAAICGAQQPDVRGVIFADRNGNGVRDPGERGLGGVVVSNQDAVIVTDSAGAFHIPRGRTGIVFVSVPDGYRPVGSFWRAVTDPMAPVAFALAPVPAAREFTFVHASDTHIAPASLARTQRLRTLVDSIHPAFALIAGDLVRDALRVGEVEARSYYDMFARETKQFVTPLWLVPGNHENFGIERALSHVGSLHPLYGRKMYRSYFGPDYYSFTYGGVHFIGLNSVDIDDTSYYGHVDSLQLAWLERDLSHVPAAMPVVTFNHIPMASSFLDLAGYTDSPPAPSVITVKGKAMFRHTVANAGEVLAVLRTHRHVLALGAHIHAAERIVFEIEGVRTRFEQSAAVVAPSGAASMRFPSGITVYTVRGGEIDAGRFLPLGQPK